MRPGDVFPARMLEELRRLNELPYPFAVIKTVEYPTYECRFQAKTWLQDFCAKRGADIAGLISDAAWLKHGPKVVRVAEEQYQALCNVDVNLELKDVQLPYPSVMVEMPPGHLHDWCLVHRYSDEVLILTSMSRDHASDVNTLIRQWEGHLAEEALEKHDDDLQNIAARNCQTLRVAVNILLCLVDRGFREEWLLPAEAASDTRLAREFTPRGARAKVRLAEQPKLISFAQVVKLHDSKSGASGHSGAEMPFHWRRGHWRMQAYGARMQLRRRLYIAPCMVREDKLTVPASETSVTYEV